MSYSLRGGGRKSRYWDFWNESVGTSGGKTTTVFHIELGLKFNRPLVMGEMYQKMHWPKIWGVLV